VAARNSPRHRTSRLCAILRAGSSLRLREAAAASAAEVLKVTSVQELIAAAKASPRSLGNTPAEAMAFLKAEIANGARVIRMSNVKTY
jgi:hypothetical protein